VGASSPEFKYDHCCCNGIPNKVERCTRLPMIFRKFGAA